MIIGRSLAATFPPRPAVRPWPADAVPVLEARGLATDGKLADASFALRPGEILGVAGLQGMGQQELFLACFGMTALRQGELLVDGRPVTLASPRDAVRANIGISLVPEDRKTEGLFLQARRQAQRLAAGDRPLRPLRPDRRRGRDRARWPRCFDEVEVEPRALYTRAGAFSGGNQQKIAIGKWLLAESRILLHVRPHARHRRRHQARALSADARASPTPAARSCSTRPRSPSWSISATGCSSSMPAASPPSSTATRSRRRRSCARPWASSPARPGSPHERCSPAAVAASARAGAARLGAPSRPLGRDRGLRSPVRDRRTAITPGAVQLFRAELHVLGRRHAGAGRDRPDGRRPDRRLRPLGRGGRVAGQRRARHLDGSRDVEPGRCSG